MFHTNREANKEKENDRIKAFIARKIREHELAVNSRDDSHPGNSSQTLFESPLQIQPEVKAGQTHSPSQEEETKAHQKAYREARKAKIKAGKKAYREAHKEETKAYREAHKAEIKADTKARREAHKEKIKARNKAYREAHKDELNARKRAYYQTHKEKEKARNKSYLVRKKKEWELVAQGLVQKRSRGNEAANAAMFHSEQPQIKAASNQQLRASTSGQVLGVVAEASMSSSSSGMENNHDNDHAVTFWNLDLEIKQVEALETSVDALPPIIENNNDDSPALLSQSFFWRPPRIQPEIEASQMNLPEEKADKLDDHDPLTALTASIELNPAEKAVETKVNNSSPIMENYISSPLLFENDNHYANNPSTSSQRVVENPPRLRPETESSQVRFPSPSFAQEIVETRIDSLQSAMGNTKYYRNPSLSSQLFFGNSPRTQPEMQARQADLPFQEEENSLYNSTPSASLNLDIEATSTQEVGRGV